MGIIVSALTDIDPKPNSSISNYAAFANAPILMVDPLGDTTMVYTTKGRYITTIYDENSFQVHYVDENADLKLKIVKAGEQVTKEMSETERANLLASVVRENSEFYFTRSTVEELDKYYEKSNEEQVEKAGFLYLDPNSDSKELKVHYSTKTIERETSVGMNYDAPASTPGEPLIDWHTHWDHPIYNPENLSDGDYNIGWDFSRWGFNMGAGPGIVITPENLILYRHNGNLEDGTPLRRNESDNSKRLEKQTLE